MARRIARSSTVVGALKTARNKNKKRSLDAYAQAQKLVQEKGIAKHRLGEDLDDEPKQKRRRPNDGDEDDDDEEEEQPPQRKGPTKQSLADRENNVEYGSDSDGNEWTMGGLGQDDDDSDLDSDEAFGESDEDRFEGFTFRGSSSGKSKTKRRKQTSISRRTNEELDLNEDEESEEDSGDSEDDEGLGLGEDAIDLAAMLDDDDEEVLGGKDSASRESGEDSGSDEEDNDERYTSRSESEEEEDDDDDDDNVADEEAVARNRDRIEALNVYHQTQPSTSTAAAVTLEDFEEDAGVAPEKISKTTKKQNRPTAIAAPLPQLHQDRLDREAASGKAKAELEKWIPGIKQIRRAEHLSFPLQHPDEQGVTLGKEKFLAATQSAPQNELENSIQRIMEESGLAAKQSLPDRDDVGDAESALLKAEELAVKDMPVEEVTRRRAELRRARELLFREEIKAKRLAKIKSKSHRRVMRKQKEREKEAMQALGEDSMDEGNKDRADRERAEARMSTKHRDSKWAKSLKQTNRTAWDDDARHDAIEQARRNEELKKRIGGKSTSEDEGSDDPSDDIDADDEDLFETLNTLQVSKSDSTKGLAALKFMQTADQRKRRANDEEIERLRKELAVADGDNEESEPEEEESLGRAVFGPQNKEIRNPAAKEERLEFEVPEGSDEDDENEDVDIVTEKLKPQEAPKPDTEAMLRESSTTNKPSVNGWLKAPRQPTANGTSAWLKASKSQSAQAEPNAHVHLDLSITSETPHRARASLSGTTDTANSGAIYTTADSDEEDFSSDPILNTEQQKQALQRRAFAGDEVEAAFQAEKADLAASEDEKEISHHLPGWGSWTGEGLSRSIRKANQRAKHNPLFKTKVDGVKQADRKDVNLKNVIISEKQDRKGKKYLAPMLPHQFETKEQYERSRRMPMGPEWTTKEVHQRMTKPRIVVAKGVNIKPLERPIA